ncbi:cysteine synthase family protein [Sphingobacterium sp. lm-10]|uniref:PLP-dependent cysteine synthase family protein n=1 Tax=Sphingobacterium sp. lm-10 TaxID=2944904 RepID=UPI00202155A1|nr:cysteine synthase family protein [Sphingobacterium sp. lm-10]MCL7987414.1 cysteine synthase family protein [Sphingobacterium sp. lm-10]
MIKNGTLEFINNTPLIALDKIETGVVIYAKAEFTQLGGSIKDRVAYQIITDAYASGKLKKGQLVVEMTSGNMGAGLAVVCKQFGNPFVAVMSEGNSPERRKILKALGAELLLTKQVDGIAGMVTGKDIAYAGEIAKEYALKNNAFYVDQFNNPSNVLAHYNTTGQEIWNDLPEVDAFVATIGSGGTFVGTSSFLKSKNKNIKCVAVEPENSAIIKTGSVKSTKHIIQGTGYSSIPPHWKEGLADDIITVSDDEVREMTKRLSSEQGLFVGYSSGANVAGTLKYLKQNPSIKNIVTILCDTGYKYSDL